MEYWHNLITEKSWNILQKIRKEFNFVLIGGWATYLYTKSLKSKDIDIIVDFDNLNEIEKNINLIEGFKIVKPEILIILKQAAELDRGYSEKGEKDRIDIMSLLSRCEINFKNYNQFIKKYNLEGYKNRLISLIKNFRDLDKIDLNVNSYKKIKLKILNELK